jgi:hypothetical protein
MIGRKYASFDDISKPLTTNRLNFIDMSPNPKTALKEAGKACQKATIAS